MTIKQETYYLVDVAMILSNCKIIAQGTPKELINNPVAQNAYFGKSFKIN